LPGLTVGGDSLEGQQATGKHRNGNGKGHLKR